MRQVAYMQLPPAKTIRPMRAALFALVDKARIAARAAKLDPHDLSTQATIAQMLRREARPIIKAAKAGNGAEVRRRAGGILA